MPDDVETDHVSEAIAPGLGSSHERPVEHVDLLDSHEPRHVMHRDEALVPLVARHAAWRDEIRRLVAEAALGEQAHVRMVPQNLLQPQLL